MPELKALLDDKIINLPELKALPDDKIINLPESKALPDDKIINLPELKALPDDKIINLPELKALTDDKLNVTENQNLSLGRNIVEKKNRSTGYQHFLLFLQCFFKRLRSHQVFETRDCMGKS